RSLQIFRSCRWNCFRFANGSVKNPDRLDFSLYKNTDETNPRKKNRRILVAESDRLSYVGHNFGAGSLKCNNLCKYYVGVLNKQTMQMEVHNAQLFNMQPAIPDCTQIRKKLALSSRKLNQVGSDTLQHAVDKAAKTVINKKGLEALQQEVADAESQGELALHLPPCNADADKQENVYPFDNLLSPVEFEALEEAGSKMAAVTSEELQKMRDDGGCLSVVRHLENLPTADEARVKTARCAFYLSLLLKLLLTVPFPLRLQNTVSASMRAKIAAYCLALLLHLGHMTADLTLLHRDLRITEARMIEVAKSMGLTIIRPARAKADEAGLQDNHTQASLLLPLVKYEQFTERRKRKKMH
uniref:RNA polymerase I subunit E n=1 Tax=Acanthochromis polyacanthus TaxID=80966 RepID=A0A3Q1F1T7_9TELE